jgi:hypothetical protein
MQKWVLNWIEAKAELATMGGTAVTQADLDASINAFARGLWMLQLLPKA